MPSVTEAADNAGLKGSKSRVGAGYPCCTGRRMQVVGYLPVAAARRVDCERPLRAVCRGCDASEQWACGNSSSAKCAPCSDRVRRLYARVIEQGLADGGGFAYFLTLTAPSNAPHRQWVQGKVTHRPDCDCWDHGLTMGQWNRQESACWNRLRTAIGRIGGDFAYAGAVEAQDRGALHRHVVIRTAEPLDSRELQRLALVAGYGCVMDLQKITSPAAMGRYLSKYVTKGGDRERVPWESVKVNLRTGELIVATSPTYRLRSQSRSWGPTMAGMRAIAGAQARARAMYLRELAQLLDQADVSAGAGPALDASVPTDPP